MAKNDGNIEYNPTELSQAISAIKVANSSVSSILKNLDSAKSLAGSLPDGSVSSTINSASAVAEKNLNRIFEYQNVLSNIQSILDADSQVNLTEDLIRMGYQEIKYISESGVEGLLYIPPTRTSTKGLSMITYLPGATRNANYADSISYGLPYIIKNGYVLDAAIYIPFCKSTIASSTTALNNMFSAIDEIATKNNFDKNRMVLMGVSMGGDAGYRLIADHPDYFSVFVTYSASAGWDGTIQNVGKQLANSSTVFIPLMNSGDILSEYDTLNDVGAQVIGYHFWGSHDDVRLTYSSDLLTDVINIEKGRNNVKENKFIKVKNEDMKSDSIEYYLQHHGTLDGYNSQASSWYVRISKNEKYGDNLKHSQTLMSQGSTEQKIIDTIQPIISQEEYKSQTATETSTYTTSTETSTAVKDAATAVVTGVATVTSGSNIQPTITQEEYKSQITTEVPALTPNEEVTTTQTTANEFSNEEFTSSKSNQTEAEKWAQTEEGKKIVTEAILKYGDETTGQYIIKDLGKDNNYQGNSIPENTLKAIKEREYQEYINNKSTTQASNIQPTITQEEYKTQTSTYSNEQYRNSETVSVDAWAQTEEGKKSVNALLEQYSDPVAGGYTIPKEYAGGGTYITGVPDNVMEAIKEKAYSEAQTQTVVSETNTNNVVDFIQNAINKGKEIVNEVTANSQTETTENNNTNTGSNSGSGSYYGGYYGSSSENSSGGSEEVSVVNPVETPTVVETPTEPTPVVEETPVQEEQIITPVVTIEDTNTNTETTIVPDNNTNTSKVEIPVTPIVSKVIKGDNIIDTTPTKTETIIKKVYVPNNTNENTTEQIIPQTDFIVDNDLVDVPIETNTEVIEPVIEPIIDVTPVIEEKVILHNNHNNNIGKIIGGVAAAAGIVGAGIAAKKLTDKENNVEDSYVDDGYYDNNDYVYSDNKEENNYDSLDNRRDTIIPTENDY